MKKYIFAITLFGIYLNMFSQQTKYKFQDNILRSFHYSEPFISEMHSTMNKIEIGYHKDYGPYNLSDKFSIYKRPKKL